MSGNSLNITIRQDTLFERMLVIKDSSGALVDLTGYTFKSSAKLNYASSAAFAFVFTIQNQTTAKGQVLWTLPSASSNALTITEDTVYIYDVLMIQPGHEPLSIISGDVLMQPKRTTP